MVQDLSRFVCPSCEGAVAVAAGTSEITCPHCGEFLELPGDDLWDGEDENRLELANRGLENEKGARESRPQFKSVDDVADPRVREVIREDGRVFRRRRVEKRRLKTEEPKFATRKKRGERQGGLPKTVVVGSAAGILLLIGVAGSLLYETVREKEAPAEVAQPKPLLVTLDLEAGEPGEVCEVPVEKIEEVVRRFLEAGSIEEMAGLVRDRERVLPLMQEFYARDGQGFRPAPYKAVGEDSSVAIKQKMRAVLVTLGDYSQRQIGVEDTGRGFLVDWESWVGYCGMSWDEFVRSKPTRPVVFRGTMRRENYYNFEFSDDAKWLCFRIQSLDGEGLWAYAPADTVSMPLRTWHVGASEKLAIVDLRFPENATRNDQVLIDRFVADGWVLHGGER